MDYTKHFQTQKTPQSKPIPGEAMVKNSAGGYTYEVNHLAQARRFLILGSEGGTYYTGEENLTVENAQTLVGLAKSEKGCELVKEIVDVSVNGRAPKQSAGIFALAICAGLGTPETKAAALEALPWVCRTASTLLEFVNAVKGFRGWGRALRRAVSKWYGDREIDSLAYQLLKYKNRGGYSHRDIFRLTHPKTKDPARRSLYNWVVKGEPEDGGSLPALIEAQAQLETCHGKELPDFIRAHRLTREMLPTESLNRPEVWEALLDGMPMTAMIRNLGNMSKCGLLVDRADAVKTVVKALGDGDVIRKARVHPIQVLNAMLVYKSGQGFRGKGTWSPVSKVVDALDGAFYKAFGNVPQSGQRIGLFLDISGSMSDKCSGFPLMDCRMGSTAMALATVAAEDDVITKGFTSSGGAYYGGDTELTDLDITPRRRLDDICEETRRLRLGRTDCSLPARWALKNKVELDKIVIYTDNETWHGKVHPVQALREYRQKMGLNTSLIVVAMTATRFSIADPSDPLSLDIVGFDTSVPTVISNFGVDRVDDPS